MQFWLGLFYFLTQNRYLFILPVTHPHLTWIQMGHFTYWEYSSSKRLGTSAWKMKTCGESVSVFGNARNDWGEKGQWMFYEDATLNWSGWLLSNKHLSEHISLITAFRATSATGWQGPVFSSSLLCHFVLLEIDFSVKTQRGYHALPICNEYEYRRLVSNEYWPSYVSWSPSFIYHHL